MVEKPLPNFLQIFSVDFTIQWWNSCAFLEKKEQQISKFVSTIVRYWYSQNPREEIGNVNNSNMS